LSFLARPLAKKFSGGEGSRFFEGINDKSNKGIAYVLYILKKGEWK